MSDELVKVDAIPTPGSILERDGSWLEPQETGGYLRRGKAGGKPSAELRQRMRGHVSEKMWVAVAILDADDSTHRDKMVALEFLAKYGMGQKSDKFDMDLIKALAAAVQDEIPDRLILENIQNRWNEILREFVTGVTK